MMETNMMKRETLLYSAAVATLGFLASGVAVTQDVMQAAPDHFKVKVENSQLRVIENILKPGERDALHTHPAGWYYVTQGGSMRVTYADGKAQMWEPKAGESGWMEAEAPHTSVNVGKTTIGFILVEVKSAANAKQVVNH
jgi:quercetin dioxygenase-like cupin family protein